MLLKPISIFCYITLGLPLLILSILPVVTDFMQKIALPSKRLPRCIFFFQFIMNFCVTIWCSAVCNLSYYYVSDVCFIAIVSNFHHYVKKNVKISQEFKNSYSCKFLINLIFVSDDPYFLRIRCG